MRVHLAVRTAPPGPPKLEKRELSGFASFPPRRRGTVFPGENWKHSCMHRSARLVLAATAFACVAPSSFAADRPGETFHISAQDLPKPYATPGVANSPERIARPAGVLPQVPAGFSVSV